MLYRVLKRQIRHCFTVLIRMRTVNQFIPKPGLPFCRFIWQKLLKSGTFLIRFRVAIYFADIFSKLVKSGQFYIRFRVAILQFFFAKLVKSGKFYICFRVAILPLKTKNKIGEIRRIYNTFQGCHFADFLQNCKNLN